MAPRACAATLVELQRRQRMVASGIDIQVPELWVSLVQVYGNEVTDLLAGLNEAKNIGAWGGVAAAAHSAGRGEVCINSASEMSALLVAGERAKRRAATAMNARSSRAHTLLSLRLRHGSNIASASRLVIADLGGCERLKQSGASASVCYAALS